MYIIQLAITLTGFTNQLYIKTAGVEVLSWTIHHPLHKIHHNTSLYVHPKFALNTCIVTRGRTSFAIKKHVGKVGSANGGFVCVYL